MKKKKNKTILIGLILCLHVTVCIIKKKLKKKKKEKEKKKSGSMRSFPRCGKGLHFIRGLDGQCGVETLWTLEIELSCCLLIFSLNLKKKDVVFHSPLGRGVKP